MLAATSSCVESGFDAHRTTSAPPSRRQMARFAVSAVTCRQAEMRMPCSGWFLMNSLRMICRTFMDWLAHSIRFLPSSANSSPLISHCTWVVVVDMLLLWRLVKPLNHERHEGARRKSTSACLRVPKHCPEQRRRVAFVVNALDLYFLFSHSGGDRFTKTRVAGQLGRLVDGFPSEIRVVAAEVPVSGSLAVNRPAQF